jgi:hypothetical protein
MRSRIPRYLFRLTFCIPVIWLITTIIFLQSDVQKNTSIDIQSTASEGNITVKLIELDDNPVDTIKFIKKLISRQSKYELELDHVVHDNQEQIIPPVIDEKKIDLNEPGEMGKPVHINEDDLSHDNLQKYQDGFEKHAFNAYASDLISIHRRLPDVRDPDCQKIEYKPPLITASVVICFHNEAWSVLLRSIHSIIDRSPSHLLKEIILVDDYSDMGKKVFLIFEKEFRFLK